jgi:hypothetical protein
MQRQAQQLHHLAGALLLADLTKKPPFLVRNIDQRLVCEKDKRVKPKVARLDRDSYDFLPSAVSLTEMNQRLSPKLKVFVEGVAPNGRRTTIDSSPSGNGVSVRGRHDVVDVGCRLRLSIHSIRDPEVCLHETHRIVRLHGEKQPDGKFKLSTDLSPGEKPFQFHMDQLKVIVENDITWREAMAESYKLRFHLTFMNPLEAKKVWHALDLPNSLPAQNGLWAKWAKLPRCPTATDYLPLFVAKDTTTKYVLNVKMGWGTEEWLPRTNLKRSRLATPLETLNTLKRQKSNTGLLTPASTPRSNTSVVSTDVAVRYLFNGHVMAFDSYRCLLNGCRPYNLGSLDRLECHIANCHPSLEFSINMDSTNGAIDESFVDIEIKSAPTDARPKGRGRGGRGILEKADSVIDDITFNLPGDPFTPIGVQQALKSSRWSLGRQVRETLPTAPVAPEFMSLANIKTELPERVRKRQPVVPHPKMSDNVTFVSSDNKAALVQGEVLSDEDDAVDESHLTIARSTQMMEQISNPNARSFLLDLNAHIESEGIQGDKYLGPCLWRWLHKRQAWLRDTAVAQLFEALVWEAYNSKNYISAEVYKACMDKSQSIQNERAGRNNQATAAKEEIPVKRGKDSCSCGTEVMGVRDRAICANKVNISITPILCTC